MRTHCVNNPFTITTVFGDVPGYPLNNGFHTGVDYVTANRLIVAPQDSVVTAKATNSKDGNYLVLDMGGFRDWFSHIAEYRCNVGDAVKKGQILAVMGATGAADGVHVHHSLRVNGELVDPELYIKEQYMNTRERVIAVFKAYLGQDATEAEIAYWVGRPNTELDDSAASSRFARDAARIAELEKGYAPVSEQLYRKA